MIQNTIKSLILLLTVAVIVSACRPEQEMAVVPTLPDITIAEAKAWFTGQNANARLTGGQSTTRRTEHWEFAEKTTYKNGLPVVVIPLTYNYDYQTASGRETLGGKKNVKKIEYIVQKKLLVYKNPKGMVQADIISIIPTDENRKKSPKVKGDTFDGYVLAYDKTEKNFMGGWYYKNGKAKNRVRLTGSKSGRVAGDCDILVYVNRGSDAPAHVGGGGSNPDTGFRDEQGNYWELDHVIPMPCGQDGGDNGNPGDNIGNPSLPPGSPQPGNGDGDPGGSDGGAPYTPGIIGDNGNISTSSATNFFYDLRHNRGITFTDTEKSLIELNFVEWSNVILNHLNATGQKPDLSIFIIDINASDQQMINAINELMDQGVPTGLKQRELELMGFGTSQFRNNLNKYYNDAHIATIRATLRYEYTEARYNALGRGNAFKHAFFAIMHAQSFGRSVAQELANAHEEYDVNTSPTDYSLEIQMDLWNNQAGFDIYDVNSGQTIIQFDNATFQAVSNGVMRFLSNRTLMPTF